MKGETMLVLKNVSKTFSPGTPQEKRALCEVGLTLEKGDFVTVIGSNGAGKSTLFQALAGAFFIDRGMILLDGEDITLQKEYQRSRVIGRLFQDPLRATAPHLTIEENLALACLRTSHRPHFRRIGKGERDYFRERLAQLDMGLEHRLKQPVGLLSGGQRQALALLIATAAAPKLLLLDEHTAALDPVSAEKVLGLTRQIAAEQGITCLMITHSMEQALGFGNRTILMDHGTIALDIRGEERRKMTVYDLLAQFSERTGTELCHDGLLLSCAK